ncbi:MAG: hypothetical protein V3U89_02145 [Methylophilaceae bacterium]
MQITRQLLVASIALSLFAISGCVSQKESMVKQGYPLAYVDGFDDGCHSGKKAGGSFFDQFKKDVKRFNKDAQYSQGWSDGFRQCETEEESLQRQVRMNIERQRLMEERKHNAHAEQRHLEREVMKGIDTRGLKNLK